MLDGLPLRDDKLLIGPESLDDAGVFRLNENSALIQTVDFFTPLVDDPYDFGAIAAANALSDVYAMGGVPLTALAIMCFPTATVKLAVMREILLGGMETMREAGAAVAGGHSVVDKEIKFGFAVTGHIDPSRVVRVSGARPGDVLVLTKPIGTGVIAHTLKAEGLEPDVGDAFVSSMKELNAAAAAAMVEAGAHACTDITGFGLLGHALSMAKSSDTCMMFRSSDVPLLPKALDAASRKMIPGGLKRNKTYISAHVESACDPVLFDLLCDPQTSGGLLIAVPPEKAEMLLDALHGGGNASASRVGEVTERKTSYLAVA